jgi:hypothetical protein
MSWLRDSDETAEIRRWQRTDTRETWLVLGAARSLDAAQACGEWVKVDAETAVEVRR